MHATGPPGPYVCLGPCETVYTASRLCTVVTEFYAIHGSGKNRTARSNVEETITPPSHVERLLKNGTLLNQAAQDVTIHDSLLLSPQVCSATMLTRRQYCVRRARGRHANDGPRDEASWHGLQRLYRISRGAVCTLSGRN